MQLITEILIGIGLAMDASAVSMAGGANTKKGLHRGALSAALAFGIFQFAMLLIGGLGGVSLKASVSGIDHWVAFFLLAFVGIRMIIEAVRAVERRADLMDFRLLLVLAVATSIDALGVGVGVAFANHYLLETAIVVGVVTGLISFVSVFIGRRYGASLGGKAEILGGLVLILIGINILMTHLSA